MALTDPELDLLRELLEDDPTSELYVQVGAELVRRGQFADALPVLARGVAHDKDPEGHTLLARAALEVGEYDVCLSSLEAIDSDPTTAPDAANVKMLAYERKGELALARSIAEALLEVQPDDVVAGSVLERLDAPPPDATGRASDPFVTVERAERYVIVGRTDRAIRIYRRVLFHNPGDRGIELRLRQLSAGDSMPVSDDLSEELTDPSLAPPEFKMPAPGIKSTDSPAVERSAEPSTPTPTKPKGRRRRRSLIRR